MYHFGTQKRHGADAVIAVLFLLLYAITNTSAHARSNPDHSAGDLLVVDCLLMGQIRQLGKSRSYLSARSPVKTTAQDCRIRGGEYVTYDHASYSTALRTWLPAAKKGDQEARVYVGEIYEKGLGLSPDYPAAAYWYHLAAVDGNIRAQINLAHLYEKGLGVNENPAEALKWYRMASGLGETIALDPGTVTGQRAPDIGTSQKREVSSLREQVKQLTDETKLLDGQLQQTQQELKSSRQQLKKHAGAEQSATNNKDAARELKALRLQISERDKQERLLQNMLKRTQEQLAQVNQTLDTSERKSGAHKQGLENIKSILAGYKQDAEKKKAELATLRADRNQNKEMLASQQADITRLENTIKQLEEDASRQSATSVEVRSQKAVAERALVGPTLTILDPQIPATRGTPTVTINPGITVRKIVGQISAPAGLLALSVNDQDTTPNDLGVFSASIPLGANTTPVSVVAIDQQGKRSTTDFILKLATGKEHQDSGSPVEALDKPIIPEIKFGNYYALVIGNNNYSHLPDLETAINDANAVSKILETKYRFKVTKLIDATRYDVLSALNKMRETLTKEDNLLIYYAGHGELDKTNMRGHWLPTDAEATSTANWLSNVAITDVLNVINAKGILLVADSCYSGTLTRSALSRIKTGLTEKERLNWLKTMVKKRTRTVLTSGGLEPVLDSGGGEHSVFGKAFLDVLDINDNILEGQRLYQEVSARVAYAASKIRFEQVPEYAPIKYSGHEGGDFFLVPAI